MSKNLESSVQETKGLEIKTDSCCQGAGGGGERGALEGVLGFEYFEALWFVTIRGVIALPASLLLLLSLYSNTSY